MAEIKSQRFTKYFPLLLDALRSTDPVPMRPAEARAWIRARIEVSADEITRLIKGKGKQTIFENDVHWARFYLRKADLIASPKRGRWGLTPLGRQTQLSPEETWDLYVRIRDAHRPETTQEEELPAPDAAQEEDDVTYWFVGAVWHKTDDQMPRFIAEGVWENGYEEEQFGDRVREMKPGDRVAIKASFVKKRGLPFDVNGKSVSVMRIKATGTVLENLADGQRVKVAWDPLSEPRDWYFYTYRTTIVRVDIDREDGRRLIDFAFHGGSQDYQWFLDQPYWAEKYQVPPQASISALFESEGVEEEETTGTDEEPGYTLEDIVDDGCFLSLERLQAIDKCWRKKKNLVLQGPPGTGKTWLAKRLGFALLGSNDRETTRFRLRVVQFHPSLAYEDFVRGYRPEGDGRLCLTDGILMQSIEAASKEPDRPFVLVIEEINRGNPAQIFGEMLTLLEDTKRVASEGIELAYRKIPGERVHIPENLYLIGTMNIADRSLAIVDLALRRRFAFEYLEPQLGAAWRAWCIKRGLDEKLLDEIERRFGALNSEITATVSLGRQFQIGHSYITPASEETIPDGSSWFRAIVRTEIKPLLDEYWYDNPEKASELAGKLLVDFGE